MTAPVRVNVRPGSWSVFEGQLLCDGTVRALVLGAEDFPSPRPDLLDEATAECHAYAMLLTGLPALLFACRRFLAVPAAERSSPELERLVEDAVARAISRYPLPVVFPPKGGAR